jgi:LmeA-like phospholipid-binding
MNESLSWIAAGLFALTLGGNALTRSFEASAARDLKSRLQGQPSVRISTRTNLASLWGDIPSVKIVAAHFSTEGLPLYTEPNRSTRGKVHRFEMHLRDFTLSGLHIDQLDASIPNCRYDFGLAARHRQIRLSRSGIGSGTVQVRDADLATFLTRKYQEIKTVTVRIHDGVIDVDGHGEFIILTTNFHVRAKLGIRSDTQLVLLDPIIEFDGRRADPAASSVLLEALSPIVDLDEDLGLLGAIKLKSIELGEGFLRASGQARIPERPKP